jgi:hypothetical protein
LHAVHKGQLQATDGARSLRLDDSLDALGITALHHIKLDVDGNEPDVVRGATASLARFKPTIFMELAPYLYREDPARFTYLLTTLLALGYRFFDERSGRELPQDVAGITALVPAGGSVNVVARAGAAER